MKRDSVDRMLQNETLVYGVQDMSQKIINPSSHKVGRQLLCLSPPKSNCFIAARAIGARKALFNL